METSPSVRAAVPDDWPAVWAFMRQIVAAGETFSWHRDLSEADSRARWFHGPPGGALVAVDDRGAVIGSATYGPNHEGPAAHIATASFMVDPARFGEGAGRALGSGCWSSRAPMGTAGSSSTRWSRATSARWPSGDHLGSRS